MRGGAHRARRTAISFLSIGLLSAGLVASVATVKSPPASAEGNQFGYYTSANGISGWCVDPGNKTPESRNYILDPGYFGSDRTKVLAWMGTHYGPKGANPTGGAAYPGDGGFYPTSPRLQGVAAASAGAVTTSIGHDTVLFEGKNPIHTSGTQFEIDLYNFANAHPGPWHMTIARDFAGPYKAGNTYTGYVAIDDRDGNRVPVGGINVQVSGQTGVSVNLNPSGNNPGHVTNVDGRLSFSFKPSGTKSPFDADFTTNDVPVRARIYEPTSDFAQFQRLMVASSGDSSAKLRGLLKSNRTQGGVLLVGKVNETGKLPLAGAHFTVYNAAGAIVVADIVTNADGLAVTPLLPAGVYRIKETQAPEHYITPPQSPGPGFGPDSNDPFATNQLQTVVNDQITPALFADRPKPGALFIGKGNSNFAAFTGLNGATFRVQACAAGVTDYATCAAGGGPTVDVTTSTINGVDGLAAVGPLAQGFYNVTEIAAPPGYTVNGDPQIKQVFSDQVTPVVFLDKKLAKVATTISTQLGDVGTAIHDTITVSESGGTGTDGYVGAINWTLLGPVPSVLDAAGKPTCVGVDYGAAPTAASGSVSANGDGSVDTSSFTVVLPGCYTYVETLVGNDIVAPAEGPPAGTVTETIRVRVPNQPEVSTQASKQQALVGDTIHDTIAVDNSNGYKGPITFTLFGPVAPLGGATPTCVGVSYATAPLAQTGTVNANGDVSVTTPDYKITEAGCYTFTELLVGSPPTVLPAPGPPAGSVLETVLASPTPNQPLVSTQISTQTANVGDKITDAITVTNSRGYQGPVNYTLLGPVPAKVDAAGAATCIGVNYAGAPTAQTGTITANGDNTYTTAPFTVKTAGCYTYSELLVGNATTPAAGPSVPGAVSETVLTKAKPEVSTQISAQTAKVGDTIKDNIAVTGSQGYQGPVNWTLLGPLKPALNAAGSPSCVGLDWTGAPTAASGSVAVNGDATYTTAGFTVTVTGCYTYTELLVGDNTTSPAGPSTPGKISETVLVVVTIPELSTQVSTQQALVGDTINDKIILTGATGYTGEVNWTLYGPVTPKLDEAGSPTCVGVVYTGAPIAATGSVTANGNGTYTTVGVKVTVTGCYTYSELLVGTETVAPVGPTKAGLSTETTIVFAHTPMVSTQISTQSASVGDVITDAIKVSGSFGYKGPVDWALLGPVTAKLDASGAPTCEGINWTGAATAATGTVTANGDGTYITAGYTVAVEGCYTYVEYLVGNRQTTPAGPSTPGEHSETVLVTTPAGSSGGGGGGTGGGGGLATTGSDVALLALGGLVLIAGGGALMFATKRRRRSIAE